MYFAVGWRPGLGVRLVGGKGIWITVVGSKAGLCVTRQHDRMLSIQAAKWSDCWATHNTFLRYGKASLPSAGCGVCAECRIWPIPTVSDSNLYTEKRRWRPARGYLHCIVTLKKGQTVFSPSSREFTTRVGGWSCTCQFQIWNLDFSECADGGWRKSRFHTSHIPCQAADGKAWSDLNN